MKSCFVAGVISTALVLSVGVSVAQAPSSPQPHADAPAEVEKYFREGNAYYLKHDYKGAIGAYSEALELEKKSPTLNPMFLRVLVDNLGMAYGISGELDKAKQTFEYGLTRDDKYPIFYYNLACTYAEMGDMEGAITNLERAFEYKDNQNPGERMPNPRNDESFKRFMKDDRFLGALKEFEQASRGSSANALLEQVKIQIPEEPWSISFDSPRLSEKKESRRDADYAFTATSDRFNISLFVEKPHGAGDSHKDCYRFYWPQASQSPLIAKDTVEMSETSKYVRVQYDIVTKFQGKPIRQRNVNYYAAFSGKWIDVHISIIAPTKKDADVFAVFDRTLSYGP